MQRHASLTGASNARLLLGIAGLIVASYSGAQGRFCASDVGKRLANLVVDSPQLANLAILPIGDHFTMGPFEAAHAARLVGAPLVVPAHHGTFPVLTGTPGKLREQLDALGLRDIEVAQIQPGQTLG